MSLDNNNTALGYLNQLDVTLPFAPTSNVDGSSPDNVDLDQFMDASFFDFDSLYHTTQFQGFEKSNLQNEFHQELAKVETIQPSSDAVQDDFLAQYIKTETNEDDLKLYSLKSTPSAQSTISEQSPKSQPFTPSTAGEETEKDKKKRNTAASARFRIKKKLKEQEMERTLKALTERVQAYNSRIQQLEFENKCLKGLIIEKNERKSDDMVRSIRQRSLNDEFQDF